MRKKTKLTLNVRKKKHYYPKRDFMGSPTACVAQKRLSARKLKNTPKISAKPLNITSPILSSQKKKTLKRSQTKGSPRKIHYTPTKSPHHKRFKPSKLPFTCLKPETNQPESSSFSCFKPIDSDSDDEIHIKVNNSSVEDEVKHSDQSSETQDEMNEMIRLIPIVLDKITSEGLERNLFVDFFRQISSNTYPIKNIAFLLWTEVVSWYNQDTSSTMRYSEETKKFWKLGYQIFGGKFIRFMSGFKNESQIVFGEASKGKCAPDKSDINFVVPTLRLLREFKPYGSGNEGMQEPGIFYDYIQEISPSLESKSACLTFDGKKLKQGLTSTSGDVNILGFEDGPSLDERLSALKVELDKETAIISNLVDCVDDTKQLPEASKSQLKQDFDRIRIKLSKNVQEIREVKRKKEYAKEKFIERGGSDWRHGTFVYVISAIHAYLFDINCYLTRAGEVMETINRWNAYLQNSERMYAQDNVVKLQIQSNYIPLPDVTTETENTRYIKQRTEQWLNIRKEAKVSGSTIYGALGLDGLKAQKQHFDKVICGFADPSPTQEAMKAMQYGTDNEINAVSTLVGRIMPVVAPDLCYHEEGCYRLDDNSFMIVSPDGSLRKDDDSCVMGVEFKCPTIKVHTEVPVRYYLQCLAEMEVLDCDQLLFVSWRPDITTVFLILRNSTLFRAAYEVAKLIYGVTNPKRPTKLLESSKRLKEEIKICCNRSRFLGEFQSVTLATTEITAPTSELLGGQHKVSDLKQLYNDIGQLTRDGYELLRQKASEALVFLCCDLDRTWNKDELRWSPVCWCPKGYSLSTETLRKLLEKVHDECFAAGIHVPAVSFDGQWHNVVVRSVKWKPLTILQLQKDTWKEVLNMTKTAILKEVMKVENKPNWYWIDLSSAEQINGDTPSGRMLICTNNGLAVPKTTSKGWVTKSKVTKGHKKDQSNALVDDNGNQETTLLDAMPDEILESVVDEMDRSPLSLISDHSVVEEMLSSNPDVNDWMSALADMQEIIDEDEPEIKSMLESEMVNEIPNQELELLSQMESQAETGFEENEMNHDQDEAQTSQTEVIQSTSNNNEMKIQLHESDASAVLRMLQTDVNANKKGQWDNKTSADVLKMCSNRQNLEKLRDVDIRVLVRFMNKSKHFKIKEYKPKREKVNALAEMFGFEFVNENKPTKTKSKRSKNVKRLSELAGEILKKVPKMVLNISYAEYIWPERLKFWCEESTIKTATKISCLNEPEPEFWFYCPEYSETRQQLEVRCIDSTHLLTRTRRKTCKGGIEGLDNKPWLKIAKQRTTLLSPVMVEDIVDPMSMSMALTHFSAPVQSQMRENGDFQSASLCESMLDWWRSEDEPGISAADRIQMRMKLRKRLLSGVDFSQFPPPTMYIKGWPAQLWEALVANIDAKAILYAICRNNSYNPRAFSSMMGETFFAELTNQDRSSHGCVSAGDFARFIGKTISLMQTRLDTSRNFVYRTSRTTVYKASESEIGGDVDQDEPGVCNLKCIECIHPRDHFFDSTERKRVSGRRREGTIKTDRNSLQKGTLGVRWEKARLNEAKMLPTKKMGLE